MAEAGLPQEAGTTDPLDRLVTQSGLSREFVIWYLNYLGQSGWPDATAQGFWNAFPKEKDAVKKIKDARKNLDKPFSDWETKRAAQAPTAGEGAEAQAAGITLSDPTTQPFAYLGERLSQGIEIEAKMMNMTPAEYLAYLQAGGERPTDHPLLGSSGWEFPTEEAAAAGAGNPEQDAATSAVTGAVGEIFSDLSPEDLQGLGAEGISEKFGLQQLAVQEPEAFLQAMFDKAGISPSPPIYGFLRDMMPSIVLLASTREGQDILKSPGGAVELNKAINEVMSQGFPSRQSVTAGLQGMGGFARELLEGGYESGRGQFNFVMGTLDALLGPTMAEPLRRALFSDTAATQQGDRYLSAAARGVFQGDFIDWLKTQGYPIPQLPAYQATPGAVAGATTPGAVAAPFVEEGLATKPGSAPFFPVAGGTYE